MDCEEPAIGLEWRTQYIPTLGHQTTCSPAGWRGLRVQNEAGGGGVRNKDMLEECDKEEG